MEFLVLHDTPAHVYMREKTFLWIGLPQCCSGQSSHPVPSFAPQMKFPTFHAKAMEANLCCRVLQRKKPEGI
jgi:hypothetical protein